MSRCHLTGRVPLGILLLVALASASPCQVGLTAGVETFTDHFDFQMLLSTDLDGDGDADLVGTQFGMNSVVVRRNDQAAGFTTIHSLPIGQLATRAIAADLDGNAMKDVVLRLIGSSQIAVVRLPAGTVETLQATTTAVGVNVVAGDFDGDGDQDLLADQADLFVNAGNGSFATATPIAGLQSGAQLLRVAVADLDADGFDDLIHGSAVTAGVEGGLRLEIAYGNAALALERHLLRESKGLRIDPVTGDFDGDGDLDIATVEWHFTTQNILLRAFVRTWIQGAPRSFRHGPLVSLNALTGSGLSEFPPRALDLDQDGRDDLFVPYVTHPPIASNTMNLAAAFGSANGLLVPGQGSPLNFIFFTAANGPGNFLKTTEFIDFDGDGSVEFLINGYPVSLNLSRTTIRTLSAAPVSPGPRGLIERIGLQVRHEFLGGAAASSALYRATLPGGAPAALQSFAVEFLDPGDQISTASVTSNAAGEFVLPFAPPTMLGERRAIVSANGFDPAGEIRLVHRDNFVVSFTGPLGPGFVFLAFEARFGTIPFVLAVDSPPVAPLSTPFGVLHTSILAPGPDFFATDAFGFFGPPNPVFLADPELNFFASIPPGLPSGLTRVVQLVGIDLQLNFPESIIIGPPHLIVVP